MYLNRYVFVMRIKYLKMSSAGCFLPGMLSERTYLVQWQTGIRNSEDVDQMLHTVASDQSLHCLSLIQD